MNTAPTAATTATANELTTFEVASLPEPPVGAGALPAPEPEALAGPLAGTSWPSAVRLTGPGREAGVADLLRLGATKTGPPPAPVALRLGAAKGT